MRTIQMTDKGPLLSELVDAVERGGESEIVIERDGKPVARILPPDHKTPSEQRVILGIMEGKVKLPDGWEEDFKALDEEIVAMFEQSLSRDRDLLPEAVMLDPKTIRSR